MNALVLYLLAVLATYRVARMLTLEDGPLDLFVRLRARIDPEQATWLGRGINCSLCVGFWVSLGISVLLWLDNPDFGKSELVLWWLAIAGGQTLVHLQVEQ